MENEHEKELTVQEKLESKPAFTVREFSDLFGRSVGWGYNRIYAGDIKVVKTGGVTLISADEVRRFFSDCQTYLGKRQSKAS